MILVTASLILRIIYAYYRYMCVILGMANLHRFFIILCSRYYVNKWSEAYVYISRKLKWNKLNQYGNKCKNDVNIYYQLHIHVWINTQSLVSVCNWFAHDYVKKIFYPGTCIYEGRLQSSNNGHILWNGINWRLLLFRGKWYITDIDSSKQHI